MKSLQIAIVGAGVSGIAAGRFLDELGQAVVLYEAAPRFRPGLLETRRVQGYTYDVGGGHIIYSKDAWAASFLEALYSGGALLAHSRNTKIRFGGRFMKYPFENGLSELSPELRFECLMGCIEAHRKRGSLPPPRNFRDWIDQRLGPGIARHFMIPYNEKVWCSDLEEMSADWAAGRVPEARLEDIVRAALGIDTEGYTHQIRFRYPAAGGIQDLAERLAAPVRDRIEAGHEVRHIRRKGDHRFEVDGRAFDAVIYTAPLDKAPGVVEGMEEGAARAAGALQHLSLFTFLLGLEAEDALPFSWVYLPLQEQGPINRVTFLSNYSPANAPSGKASLLAEITHRGAFSLKPDDRRALRCNLEDAALIRPGRTAWIDEGFTEYAYIFFDQDFAAKRARAEQGLKDLGIYPLGRFGRYLYLNVDQCILEAKALAERLDAEARGLPPPGAEDGGERGRAADPQEGRRPRRRRDGGK